MDIELDLITSAIAKRVADAVTECGGGERGRLDFGARLGVSGSTVQRMCGKHAPSYISGLTLGRLAGVADALGVSLGDMLSRATLNFGRNA